MRSSPCVPVYDAMGAKEIFAEVFNISMYFPIIITSLWFSCVFA